MNNILYYVNEKIKEEIKSDNIKILGHDFVKNNNNKAKLIINNKRFKLKEFINGKEFKDNKIKINMILSKGLSNVSHVFENCTKLIEFSIYDDIINIDYEEPYYYYDECYNYNADYSDDNNYCSQDNFYKDFYNEYMYSNYSEVERNKNKSSSTMNYIKDNIIIYQNCNNYYIDVSRMFMNCLFLSSLPDISNWNTINITNMSFMISDCRSIYIIIT